MYYEMRGGLQSVNLKKCINFDKGKKRLKMESALVRRTAAIFIVSCVYTIDVIGAVDKH